MKLSCLVLIAVACFGVSSAFFYGGSRRRQTTTQRPEHPKDLDALWWMKKQTRNNKNNNDNNNDDNGDDIDDRDGVDTNDNGHNSNDNNNGNDDGQDTGVGHNSGKNNGRRNNGGQNNRRNNGRNNGRGTHGRNNNRRNNGRNNNRGNNGRNSDRGNNGRNNGRQNNGRRNDRRNNRQNNRRDNNRRNNDDRFDNYGDINTGDQNGNDNNNNNGRTTPATTRRTNAPLRTTTTPIDVCEKLVDEGSCAIYTHPQCLQRVINTCRPLPVDAMKICTESERKENEFNNEGLKYIRRVRQCTIEDLPSLDKFDIDCDEADSLIEDAHLGTPGCLFQNKDFCNVVKNAANCEALFHIFGLGHAGDLQFKLFKTFQRLILNCDKAARETFNINFSQKFLDSQGPTTPTTPATTTRMMMMMGGGGRD